MVVVTTLAVPMAVCLSQRQANDYVRRYLEDPARATFHNMEPNVVTMLGAETLAAGMVPPVRAQAGSLISRLVMLAAEANDAYLYSAGDWEPALEEIAFLLPFITGRSWEEMALRFLKSKGWKDEEPLEVGEHPPQVLADIWKKAEEVMSRS